MFTFDYLMANEYIIEWFSISPPEFYSWPCGLEFETDLDHPSCWEIKKFPFSWSIKCNLKLNLLLLRRIVIYCNISIYTSYILLIIVKIILILFSLHYLKSLSRETGLFSNFLRTFDHILERHFLVFWPTSFSNFNTSSLFTCCC